MLIFTDAKSQEAFRSLIADEFYGKVRRRCEEDNTGAPPQLGSFLHEVVTQNLMVWPGQEGWMRVLQIHWCPNDVDVNGRASEFSWQEWYVPCSDYGDPLPYPHRPALRWGELNTTYGHRTGMHGGLINHSAREGLAEWRSHT